MQFIHSMIFFVTKHLHNAVYLHTYRTNIFLSPWLPGISRQWLGQTMTLTDECNNNINNNDDDDDNKLFKKKSDYSSKMCCLSLRFGKTFWSVLEQIAQSQSLLWGRCCIGSRNSPGEEQEKRIDLRLSIDFYFLYIPFCTFTHVWVGRLDPDRHAAVC